MNDIPSNIMKRYFWNWVYVVSGR